MYSWIFGGIMASDTPLGKTLPQATIPIAFRARQYMGLVTINGLIVDIRDMPLEIQQQAFARGIIPYIPGATDRESNDGE